VHNWHRAVLDVALHQQGKVKRFFICVVSGAKRRQVDFYLQIKVFQLVVRDVLQVLLDIL
jgi:hypothetical protein